MENLKGKYQYETIIAYTCDLRIQFKDCGHSQNISTKHKDEDLACNECYKEGIGSYVYDMKLGNVHHRDFDSECFLCKGKDKLINLIKIKSSKGIYRPSHQKCIDLNFGYATKKDAKSNGYIIKAKTEQSSDYSIGDIKYGNYKIINKANNKTYIGESMNIRRRWEEHIKDLNKNTHRNHKIQKDWNKFGEENFIFEKIEPCDYLKSLESKPKIKSYIVYNEHLLISKFNSIKNGYNIENTLFEILKNDKSIYPNKIPSEKFKKVIHGLLYQLLLNNGKFDDSKKTNKKMHIQDIIEFIEGQIDCMDSPHEDRVPICRLKYIKRKQAMSFLGKEMVHFYPYITRKELTLIVDELRKGNTHMVSKSLLK